ncbi:MAG: response regulator transcription factor [Pseudomonadota bacterium]
MKILIVEDDLKTAEYVRKGVEESGHSADIAHAGTIGLEMATSRRYDVMIVDRMLPEMDGLTMIGRARELGVETPALILSALGKVDDRVEGLRAGGDDYLTKPFAFTELLARVEVLARRKDDGVTVTNLKLADLTMDLLARTVNRADQPIDLQPREFKLLEYFMRRPGQVLTRTMLLEGVWDYHFDPQTNVIDVHISRLRGKIDKGFDRPLLHTVRGAGYCLREA